MTNEQFKRELIYQAILSLIRKMRRKNLITLDEQKKIDLMMLKKYKPLIGLLYSKDP